MAGPWPAGGLPANHRASRYALECCLEGFASHDGLKSMPSSERMCPRVLSRGVRVARWTQIDAIARADVPWSAVWRGSRRSMDSNRCHRAGGCALEARRTAIAVPDELQKSVGPSSEGRVWQVGVLPENYRASGCALEHCLEGFAVLDRLTVPAMTLREIHLEP